jgi:hypothetical protein
MNEFLGNFLVWKKKMSAQKKKKKQKKKQTIAGIKHEGVPTKCLAQGGD